jgi:hypothetical protein
MRIERLVHHRNDVGEKDYRKVNFLESQESKFIDIPLRI